MQAASRMHHAINNYVAIYSYVAIGNSVNACPSVRAACQHIEPVSNNTVCVNIIIATIQLVYYVHILLVKIGIVSYMYSIDYW